VALVVEDEDELVDVVPEVDADDADAVLAAGLALSDGTAGTDDDFAPERASLR